MLPTIKRNEIYYADLNPVEGSEQGGMRPVLILQNDKGNQYAHLDAHSKKGSASVIENALSIAM